MASENFNHQKFRSDQLKLLPTQSGIYALCDLDGVPIYIGKSARGKAEGIRSRARRHLSSARSDVIANRQLDVWEIGYVWAWPVENEDQLATVEAALFHKFDQQSALVNGTIPQTVAESVDEQGEIVVQIMTDEEINYRRQPRYRFPRQVQQFSQLLDHVLHTKDEQHLRRALDVHFRRVERFFRDYMSK